MTRDLKIVSAAMLTWGIGEGMFYIFQPLYIQQFGVDPSLIGTFLGINGLVMTAVQVPSGYLADRFGRRRMMWFSWITGAIATWVMALAPSLGFFVAGLLLYGVTSSVMAPLNTYIQGARGKWSVGRAVSFVSASFNVGGILGPIIGGFVGEFFNLHMVYYAAGVIFILSTLIVLTAGKQTLDQTVPLKNEGHLLQNKRFLVVLGLIFFVMIAVTLPQPLAANFLQNERGLTLSQIGQLGSLGALGSVVLMLIFGHLPAGNAMLIGQVGLIGFSFLLLRGGHFAWYAAAYLFLGGYRLCRAMTVALVRPLVSERQVGMAFGLVESLNAAAFMLAPIFAGFLYDWLPTSIFTVGLGLLGITLLMNLWFNQKSRRFYRHVDEEGLVKESA